MPIDKSTDDLITHYSSWPNYERVVESLLRKRGEPSTLRPSDLFPYDQSHAGGIEATAQLATLAGIFPGATVADIGCGVGGAARYLRSEFSCKVLGFDLTISRLAQANTFNRLTGIAGGIHYLAADASALPLPSQFADFAWTQHVTMNLPDKAAFLSETARILKPQGRLAVHEWFVNSSRENSTEILLPLPWAPDAGLNRIGRQDEFLNLLATSGYCDVKITNVTEAMIERLISDLPKQEARGAPAFRIESQRNLEKCARSGMLICLMISAAKNP